MSKQNSLKLKKPMHIVISCLCFFILSFFVYTQLSFAWNSSNRELSSNNIGMSIEGEDGVSLKNFYIYKREGDAINGSSAKLVSSSESPKTIHMTEFDPVFTDRNVNTPIIIRLELENVEVGNPDIVITTTCNTSLFKSGTAIGENLSNIIGVRCTQMATPSDSSKPDLNTIDPKAPDNAEIIYEEVSSYFSAQLLENHAPSTFVTMKSNTLTKQNTLSVTISDYTPKSDRSLILYLEIDYYDVLVSEYINSNGITFSFNDNGSQTSATLVDMIPFTYDLSDFKINYRRSSN